MPPQPGCTTSLARQWDPEALQLAGIDAEKLATVVPTTHVVTGLRSEVAEQTGLPRDLPVVVGASDGPLANLGLGAVREGIAAVSLGTSGAMRAVRPAPLWTKLPGCSAMRSPMITGCSAARSTTPDRWCVGRARRWGW